ncbi:RidA family protein [Haloterrigena alkaliphila]|uniref:RidA family protein n=1 Tax=Haloterrigena alkaliphila TaxID=2816475 RepID=A0A8A2VHW8_9EURY|nr:RidA family protein [Haloterrigena alkaliphila]QSX00311.1 RidA family protein [Haloterrigena alkaliphila]
MEADQTEEPRSVRTTPARTSESGRRQREGTAFTGAFGKKTGSSDLLFVEGQLPESDGRLRTDESPSRQLERCLTNLESELERRGRTTDDVLKLTLYFAEMDAYEAVDEIYRAYFDETRPARTTVGVCDLLGGAAVTVDAVVAIE